MNVLIAGVDGYLGWPLAQQLASCGHRVFGADKGIRRLLVSEVGSDSIIPIRDYHERKNLIQDRFGNQHAFFARDLRFYESCVDLVRLAQPEAIVHLAEIPSAPYSMIGPYQASLTQVNNVVGTLNLLYAMREAAPEAHLVKLGTMGEYGTPNIDIPEGFFEIEYRGRKDTLPFPRQAGSWYHQSKVHDSNNIAMACKVWGLRSTDIMQGVVYGVHGASAPGFETRFDVDQCFGTVINRFCAQAVAGMPLTVYGAGRQRRAFLPLKDSIRCLQLAVENPPVKGEYRVINQFDTTYSVSELADRVQAAAEKLGMETVKTFIGNPRNEVEGHYYNPDRVKLLALGYEPLGNLDAELEIMLEALVPHRERILHAAGAMEPRVRWDAKGGESPTFPVYKPPFVV